MERDYDVFISYTWADRAAVQPLAQALRDHRLRVFVDDPEIDDFARITTTITNSLAASRLLVAYYSKEYPIRRACQWELTAAYLAAQHAGDPSQRILVLNPEATPDHLHPGELRDALFRRPPTDGDPAALAELARAVADRVRELPGPLGEVAPLLPARWLPTQGLGSNRFVGRLPEMWRLHSALHPDTTRLTVAHTGPAVAQLRGLGGIGKTLLAEEYALRFGAAYPGGVFWLRAYGSHDQTDLPVEELEARRHDQLRQLAQALGLPVEGRDPEEMAGLLAIAIEQGGQACLWVVDDLPRGLEANQVRRWLAPHPLARTLLTTRSQEYDALAIAVELDVLGEDEAYELLTARRAVQDGNEQKAARGIVVDLGYHALAVDVAGAGLRNQQGLVSYADFRASLQEPERDELELIQELADGLPNGHEKSIARTLLRSIRQLANEGHDFLRLAASLAPVPIPVGMVLDVFQRADRLDDATAKRRTGLAVEQAFTLSLATQAGGWTEGAWLVHALVARTVRFHEPSPERRTSLRAAAVQVLTPILAQIRDARTQLPLRPLMPHARELGRVPTTDAEAQLLHWVARYDYERGDYPAAEALFRQEWEERRRTSGADNPASLVAMQGVAASLQARGQLNDAQALFEEILDARRQVNGEKHPATLDSMNNLAGTLQALGDLADAVDLYEQVLDARRRLSGPEHPSTLTSMNNLAEALRNQGELAKARRLQASMLPTSRRVLGEEHPITLSAKNNMALILLDQGHLRRPRVLLEEVVDARRRQLGEDHPQTILAMNNLSAVLDDLGEPDTARELLEQVVASTRRVLGNEHPRTLGAIGNLAATLLKHGDLTGCQRLLDTALPSSQRVLAKEHPITLNLMHYQGQMLRQQGHLTQAQELQEKVLEARRRLLGATHPDTLSSANNLAVTLAHRHNLGDARRLQEQVVQSYEHVLGPQHPDTRRAMQTLEGILRMQ